MAITIGRPLYFVYFYNDVIGHIAQKDAIGSEWEIQLYEEPASMLRKLFSSTTVNDIVQDIRKEIVQRNFISEDAIDSIKLVDATALDGAQRQPVDLSSISPHAEKVRDLIHTESAGITDVDISNRLGLGRGTVNTICRKLAERGVIRRTNTRPITNHPP